MIKRKPWFFAVVGLWVCVWAIPAQARPQCHDFGNDVPGGYCLHLGDPASDVVIYHFHGAGGSHELWQSDLFYPEQIREYWTEHQIKRPTVVSISFGPIWLLAEKNDSERSGLFEVFVNQVLPLIENQFPPNIKHRFLVGESMGGFNASQMAFKTHLFERVAILCAPMPTISPFSDWDVVENSIKQTHTWKYYKDQDPDAVLNRARKLILLIQAFYPTPADFQKGDPLKLSESFEPGNRKIYLSAGHYDPYLAYEGNLALLERLKARSANVQWRPQYGPHCTFDIPSLAEFLSN